MIKFGAGGVTEVHDLSCCLSYHSDIRIFDGSEMSLSAILPCYTKDAISMVLNVPVRPDCVQVRNYL